MDQPTTSTAQNGPSNLASLILEMRKESEKLQQLAEQLSADQLKIAQLEGECNSYRRLAYAWAAEKLREQPSIPDRDITTLVAELDGKPFEVLLAELERIISS